MYIFSLHAHCQHSSLPTSNPHAQMHCLAFIHVVNCLPEQCFSNVKLINLISLAILHKTSNQSSLKVPWHNIIYTHTMQESQPVKLEDDNGA